MNTKIVMILSAAVLGLSGITLTFGPNETAKALQIETSPIFLQILGAAYFGFAMINHSAKGTLLGGIYGRPITIGNMSHFVIGAFALGKLAIKEPGINLITIVAIIYLIFAILFVSIFYTHPGRDRN